mmetsp:Transcript_9390/g.18347  ORF Transcript_9390/g.18347 Transcript_9390/m.18347 type:complete len:91 (+) Transcript_9390:493-765(+)
MSPFLLACSRAGPIPWTAALYGRDPDEAAGAEGREGAAPKEGAEAAEPKEGAGAAGRAGAEPKEEEEPNEEEAAGRGAEVERAPAEAATP